MITAIEILGGIAFGAAGLLGLNRRLRDRRLDQDWAGDQPAPYDAPADSAPLDMPRHFGAENAGAYHRMLDNDRPPLY